MVSSTITLDKKSSSSSSSAAAAASTAQASAEQNSNSIISIPLNATASTSNGTNCNDSSSSTTASALGLTEQKISILFPKCKPRVAEHYQTNAPSGILNSNNNNNNMSTITSNSKSDITGTSSSLTTPTSLTSSSYTFNSTSYGMENSTFRGNGGNGAISGTGAGYDLLGSRPELSSRLNNNQYESSRSNRHTNSVDKYSFYYNSQPPPLSTSPTENNANAGGSSQFLPSDDEEDENDLRKDSYPRHSYYTNRQSHYYNLPKQDPGTPSNSRYHWDLSSSGALSYSTPISSTITSTSGGKRPSIKSSYTKVLQSPLEDESDIEDKLKYFNYQNEMHIGSTNVAHMATASEKPSGIYSNYKTNEMIVFNDIDEERRRVQQQQQRQETDHKHNAAGAGLHVSATADDPDDGISLHRRNQPLQDNIGGGGGDGSNCNETSSAHKTATPAASNSGSNIMGE